jgi:hypothetical protein
MKTMVKSSTLKQYTLPPAKAVQSKAAIPAIDLNRILGAAIVSIVDWFYRVDFGPEFRPRYHHVGKDKRCSCDLGADCPSVSAVADYLKAGGEQAPESPHGFYPVAPVLCPVCGATAASCPSLGSRNRGAGWSCSKEGEKHYWRDRARIIKEALDANPWLFPPVVIRNARQQNAWDGIQPGDTVMYQGVLRENALVGARYGYLEE